MTFGILSIISFIECLHILHFFRKKLLCKVNILWCLRYLIPYLHRVGKYLTMQGKYLMTFGLCHVVLVSKCLWCLRTFGQRLDKLITLSYRWHDAGTYDAKSKTGGPNGSIRNEKELNHSSNNGLKIAIDLCGEFLPLVCVHWQVWHKFYFFLSHWLYTYYFPLKILILIV